MCGPSAERSRARAVMPARRASAVEDDDDEDPDLSFLDELRDPEGAPHSFDDPETTEAQRDPEHEMDSTPDDQENQELPPGRRGPLRGGRSVAAPRRSRTR